MVEPLLWTQGVPASGQDYPRLWAVSRPGLHQGMSNLHFEPPTLDSTLQCYLQHCHQWCRAEGIFTGNGDELEASGWPLWGKNKVLRLMDSWSNRIGPDLEASGWPLWGETRSILHFQQPLNTKGKTGLLLEIPRLPAAQRCIWHPGWTASCLALATLLPDGSLNMKAWFHVCGYGIVLSSFFFPLQWFEELWMDWGAGKSCP